MSTDRKCVIFPGPGEMDLQISLFGRGRGISSPLSVFFTIRLLNENDEPEGGKVKLQAQVTNLKYEGHYKRSAWFFEARASGNALIRWTTIVGEYDHLTRKGQAVITVVD